MKWIFILFLAGCPVKSEDGNYYVIQMPEEDSQLGPPPRTAPLEVYWNVPTMQCTSKKIPFNNLLQKFGIIQNTNDSFRGEQVSILYDPGFFPALFRNETSGKLRYRNGGVPQEGNLVLHLKLFNSVLEQSVPDKNFSGIGIIDFESWRPILRQNFGEVLPYKEVSYQIERERHWWWPQAWVHTEAKQHFEDAARLFMQESLVAAKQLRPLARWGYYGFPYCFNMATNNMAEDCANNVLQENDQIDWLWSSSTALYPSVYSFKDLSSSQLSMLISGRVREAARVRRRGTPILPYFWFRYRNGGFLRDVDLHIALDTFNKSEASGFIIWGSSNDVNTLEKCQKLYNYIENVMGPAVAKYTKQTIKANDNIPETLNDSTEDSFTMFTTEVIDVESNNTTPTTVMDETTENDFSIIEMQTVSGVTSDDSNAGNSSEDNYDKYNGNLGKFAEIDYEETQHNKADFSVLSIFNESSLFDIFGKSFDDYGDSDENIDDKYDISTFATTEITENPIAITLDDVSQEANYDFNEDEQGKTRTRNKASDYNITDDETLHSLLYTLVATLLSNDEQSTERTDSPFIKDENESKENPMDDVTVTSFVENDHDTFNLDELTTYATDLETSTHIDITTVGVDDKESTPNYLKDSSTVTEDFGEYTSTTDPTTTTFKTTTSKIAPTTRSIFFQQNYLFDPNLITDSPKVSKDETTKNILDENSTEPYTTTVDPIKYNVTSYFKDSTTEKLTTENFTKVESTTTETNEIKTNYTYFLHNWTKNLKVKNVTYSKNSEDSAKTEGSEDYATETTEPIVMENASSLHTEQVVVKNF